MVGTLIYIANYLTHKYRDDVNIYKNNELESTFIETVNQKKSSIIVGAIYSRQQKAIVKLNCYTEILL